MMAKEPNNPKREETTMSKDEKNLPLAEVKDEELDQVSGGGNSLHVWGAWTNYKPCPNGCGNTVPWNWEGPCPACQGQENGPQNLDDE